MTTTLVLTFPWGRYHATPWGRHVNEGAVELPPSPWRLLRALYAVWRTRVPDLDGDVVHALLGSLAAPPVFFVPRHTVAHTRHYYPDSEHTRARASTDRTLDAFAVFERGADLAAQWPGRLPDDQRQALVRLAGSIPYLGRADSLCHGSTPDQWQPTAHDTWSPIDAVEQTPDSVDVTEVLAPELPLNVESLLAHTVDIRRGGLLFPPDTRFVGYQRTVAATAPARRRKARPAQLVEAVRFSVLQAGLPPKTDALVYTDLLRRAALSRLGGLREERALTVLGGRDVDRKAVRSDHQHAHYLPLVREGRLSGLLVWAPKGFPPDELKALKDVRSLRSRFNESWRLAIRVSGIGSVDEVAPELAERSIEWTSVTPFTPSRYPKRNADWSAFLRAEIVRELGFRGIDAHPAVEVLAGDWAAYRRYRPSARMRRDRNQGEAARPSAFLRVRFDQMTAGPLALGHLSHFGLGLFVPTRQVELV